MAACGAKTRGGARCKRAGMASNGRCRLHGGASLVGPASPQWRHGRHSKYLQVGLLERYRVALADPNLITLQSEVALVDARIAELLEAVGQTGNTRLWRDAHAKLQAFKGAAGKGTEAVGAARVALTQLEEILNAGLQASATWDELADRLDLRRRLVDSETKRQKDLFQMISVDRVMQVIGLLLETVKGNVKDPSALAAINAEFIRLAGAGDHTTPAT